MKHTKALLLAAIFLFSSCGCLVNPNADSCKYQGVSVFGGANLYTQKSSYDNGANTADDNKSKSGVHLGLMSGVDLNEDFDVRGGIGFGSKRIKRKL